MFILMVVIFILGYTAIALEHPLKVDKAAAALLTGTILWALYALNATSILELGLSPAWEEIKAIGHDVGTIIKSSVGEAHYNKIWAEDVEVIAQCFAFC